MDGSGCLVEMGAKAADTTDHISLIPTFFTTAIDSDNQLEVNLSVCNVEQMNVIYQMVQYATLLEEEKETIEVAVTPTIIYPVLCMASFLMGGGIRSLEEFEDAPPFFSIPAAIVTSASGVFSGYVFHSEWNLFKNMKNIIKGGGVLGSCGTGGYFTVHFLYKAYNFSPSF